MPTLHVADGLTLSLLRPEDAAELFAAIDGDREHLAEFLPWVDDTRSEGDALAYIRRSNLAWDQCRELPLAVLLDGHIVGHLSLTDLTSTHQAELGYWLRSDVTGRGLITRSARCLIEFGRAGLGRHRFLIRCRPDNEPSADVARRLGFRYEGRLRDAEQLDDGYHDLDQYSWLSTDRP